MILGGNNFHDERLFVSFFLLIFFNQLIGMKKSQVYKKKKKEINSCGYPTNIKIRALVNKT